MATHKSVMTNKLLIWKTIVISLETQSTDFKQSIYQLHSVLNVPVTPY